MSTTRPTTRRILAGAAAAVVVVALGVGGWFVLGDRNEPTAEGFCAQIATMEELPETITGDPAAFQSAAAAMDSLAAASPPEVRPSVDVLRQALTTMATAASAEDGNATSENLDQRRLEAAITSVAADQTALEAASAEVEAYTSQTCGVSLRLEP